jgi:hypothetical protein
VNAADLTQQTNVVNMSVAQILEVAGPGVDCQRHQEHRRVIDA